MHKQILLLLIIIFSTLSVPFTGFSAGQYDPTFVHNNDDSITISGVTEKSAKAKKITLLITKSDAALQDASDGVSAADILEHTDVSYTDKDGKWSFVWKPTTLGDYSVFVSAENIGKICEKPYYYYSRILKESLEHTLKYGEISETAEVFTSEVNVRTLGISTSDIEDISNKKNIGKMLYYIRGGISDPAKITDYFEEAFELVRYNESKTSAGLDKAVSVLSELGTEISDYGFYKAISENSIKAEIAESFSDMIIDSLENLGTSFKHTVVLKGIKNNKLWSGATAYLELLDYSVYNNSQNKAKIAQAVVGKIFTIEELKAAINSADGDGISGGTSGGTSGGSSSGKPKDKVTVQENYNSSDEDSKDVADVTFSDVDETHWAFEYINHLKWQGIVNGSGGNKFFPDENISRAEILAMLCRVFSVEGTERNVFTDVAPSDWYYDYVVAAYANGLISGYEDGSFKANQMISRQDMAVMIYRFSLKYGGKYEAGDAMFNDSSSIADYAKEAVEKLAGAGVINGMADNSFSPFQNATRAQAAKLIFEINQ